VSIRRDQFDSRMAARSQPPQKRQPASPVLGGGGVDAQDLRDQRVNVDHTTGLSDLEHEGVSRDKRVRAGVERSGAKRLHRGVELRGHN
jgi:hypothetical protein